MLAILGLALGQISQAAKILVLFPHVNEGHFAVMRTLVTELANREHTVSGSAVV